MAREFLLNNHHHLFNGSGLRFVLRRPIGGIESVYSGRPNLAVNANVPTECKLSLSGTRGSVIK